MEEINRFVILAQSDRFTLTELCAQFGISRKTGYKHLERYAADGLKGKGRRGKGRRGQKRQKLTWGGQAGAEAQPNDRYDHK